MAIISLVISIVAIIISIVAFFMDFRIKKHRIKKIKIEENNEKKANIEIEITKKDNLLMYIKNSGKAQARNISIKGFDKSSEEGFYIYNKVEEYPIETLSPNGKKYVLTILLTTGAKFEKEIEIIWDDDYKKNNTINRTISFI